VQERSRQETILIVVLRLSGAVTVLAFPAILLPAEWMASIHRWLGLGEFSASTLVDYLTRSIAALYGFHGVLMLLVSCDVRRYRGIVTYLAYMYLAFGAMMLGIDLHAGMPPYWTLGEGPMIAALGILFMVLLRSVPER